jgi:hypothetical protein
MPSEPGFSEIARQAKPDRTLCCHTPDRSDGFIVQVEDALRIAKHNFSGSGKSEAATRFPKKRFAKLLLQFVNLLAHRRLGTANPLGRSIKSAQLLGRDQRPQHIHIQIYLRHRSFYLNCYRRNIQFFSVSGRVFFMVGPHPDPI